MLSVIGLMLDLVGATALALGLFRPSMPLYLGWLRPPQAAAEDQAYGVVGSVMLVSGFVLQALTYFGVNSDVSSGCAAVAAVLTLAVAIVLAWGIFGAVYIARFSKEVERGEQNGVSSPPYRRERRGYRFWHYEPVEDEE